jgi:hypothetical protein
MRLVLEWLGLVEPDRSRREPVAVPGWGPLVVASAVAVLTGVATLAVWLLFRAIFL